MIKYISYPISTPLLTQEETEAILLEYLESNSKEKDTIEKIIKIFNLYYKLKKGKEHAVVIDGREFFEEVLQEQFKSSNFFLSQED